MLQVQEAPSFSAEFNMGISKLYRLHNLLNHAHESRMRDDHKSWKTALDGIYVEIYPYLNEKKDGMLAVDKNKLLCEKKLMGYLKWESSNLQQSMKSHMKQLKQLEVESLLDLYQRQLIMCMKNHNFDMPQREDVNNVILGARA